METLPTRASGKGIGLGGVFAIAACLLAVGISPSEGNYLSEPNTIYSAVIGHTIDTTFREVPSQMWSDTLTVRNLIEDSAINAKSLQDFIQILHGNSEAKIRELENTIIYVRSTIPVCIEDIKREAETHFKTINENCPSEETFMDQLNSVYRSIYDQLSSGIRSSPSGQENSKQIVLGLLGISLRKNCTLKEFLEDFNSNYLLAIDGLNSTRNYIIAAIEFYVEAVKANAEAHYMRIKWNSQLATEWDKCGGSYVQRYEACMNEVFTQNPNIDASDKALVKYASNMCISETTSVQGFLGKLMYSYVDYTDRLKGKQRNDVKNALQASIECFVSGVGTDDRSLGESAIVL